MTSILVKKTLSGWMPYDRQAWDEHSRHKLGSVVRIDPKRSRNPRQHSLYWTLVTVCFEHQTRYATVEQLHAAIKVAVGYCDEVETTSGRIIAIPKSISFSSMSQAQFEDFFDRVIKLVCERIIPGTTDNELRAHLEDMVGVGERAA